MEWLWHIMDRSISVLCALICMQIPSFFVQYMQRLAGHIQELQRQLGTLTHLAEASGRTLPQYIQKFLNQQDHDFSDQGVWMEALVNRYVDLSHSWQVLQGAESWNRPFIFFAQADRSIALGTWEEFQPALTISTEGMLYALLGVLVGSCLVFCLRNTWGLFRRLCGWFFAQMRLGI